LSKRSFDKRPEFRGLLAQLRSHVSKDPCCLRRALISFHRSAPLIEERSFGKFSSGDEIISRAGQSEPAIEGTSESFEGALVHGAQHLSKSGR